MFNQSIDIKIPIPILIHISPTVTCQKEYLSSNPLCHAQAGCTRHNHALEAYGIQRFVYPTDADINCWTSTNTICVLTPVNSSINNRTISITKCWIAESTFRKSVADFQSYRYTCTKVCQKHLKIGKLNDFFSENVSQYTVSHHYNDAIISTMASQITSRTIIYSGV